MYSFFCSALDPNNKPRIKPWEMSVSDDEEDEDGLPRDAVRLVSWADKRNLVSRKGKSDALLLEKSCYDENVLRNMNRRFMEPDATRQHKKDRHERDLSQAWGAAHGKPRAKGTGHPDHELQAPWEVNASDGEDDPENEEGCAPQPRPPGAPAFSPPAPRTRST